jgi:HK97 family phage major capsid protein
MKTVDELRQERAKLYHDARAMLDAAEKEDRDFTEEEQTNYDTMLEDADKLRKRYERIEQQEATERELQRATTEVVEADDGETRDQATTGPRGTRAYEDAFNRYLDGGRITPDEQRALQVDDSEAGGYTVVSEQFINKFIQAVDNQVFIRQWATVLPVTSADSVGAVSLDADPADPTWTSELLIGSEDTTMDFGKRALHPHPLAQFIKVSRTLLRKSVKPVEQLVRERLAYKTGVVMEAAFLTGDGANSPLGVMTASDNGISTGRDVSTGNIATDVRFDGLYEAKYTLKGQYWPRARWMFHRDGIKRIAKLKDGEGRYIWSVSQREGEPDTVLGFPCYMSEYMSNTWTASLYVGILGDFSNYWIADSLAMQIQRLDELYAATNQVGFISRLESDAMPVLEEAFVRVKLGS